MSEENKITYSKGTKLYRYKGELLQIVRITGVSENTKNSYYSTIPVEGFEEGVANYPIEMSEAHIEWVKLNEDGIVSFNILKGEKKDVMIAIHRKEDMETGNNVPYAICRQDVVDLFKMYTDTPTDGKAWAGISVNRKNCPAEMKMEDFMLCDDVEYSNFISVYLDDKLEDILACINLSKYDNVLNDLAEYRANTNIIGNCKSVKELLEEHNFMYDFHEAFNIIEVPFPITNDTEHLLIDVLSQMERKVVTNVYPILYSKSINTSEFVKPYKLITPEWDRCEDAHKKIYIVGYDVDESINYLAAKYGTANPDEIIDKLGFNVM